MNELELMKEEISQLKKQVNDYQQLINDISAPVIPSIVPETILVPVTGKLSSDRFQAIVTRIIEAAHTQQVSTVIIDFTAITEKELGNIDVMASYIDKLKSSLNLMGVEPFFVGFSPTLTRLLVSSNLTVLNELKTFLTFRTALQYLMKEKGLKFEHLV